MPLKISTQVNLTWMIEPPESLSVSEFAPGPKGNGSSPFVPSIFQVRTAKLNSLVVSIHLKNISQNGNLPQVGVKIKNI